MDETKQLPDIFQDGLKNNKKHHLNKKREISKKNINKNDGLMLSRIEEFIEIGNGQKGLLDTCVLKNLNQLFLNKDGVNNKDNNIFGYTLDNKNNTIIKFNKSPNQLQIEQFTFPNNKPEQRLLTKKIYHMHDDSFVRTEMNNISENKGNINFLKKFKEDYPSDPENKKKHRQIKSNIILCPKKLNKELRTNKYKNTVLLKESDINNILVTYNKKPKKNDKEKENNEQKNKLRIKRDESKKFKDKENNNINNKEKLKIKREESKKIKDKDNFQEDDDNINNNITTIRRKKKSKTRKQQQINFLFNKGKKFTKKNSENYFISNNSIQRIVFDERINNNDEDNKKNNKQKFKSNKQNNLRASIKSCLCENNTNNDINTNNNININNNPQKSSKTRINKKKKNSKFQSVLFTKNKNLFDPKNNVKPKRNSNALSKNEDKKKDKDSDIDSLKIPKKEKDKKNNNNNNFEEKKNNNKERHKKHSYQNNIRIYKDNFNNSSEHSNSGINQSHQKNTESNAIKDINCFKNNIQKISQYKIKHVNNLYVGRSANKEEKNNSILKIPAFSVVKPENLISFEYNREYETRINKNNVISKNIEDNSNDTNKREKKVNDENDKNKINKRSKSLFCCL